MSDHVHNYNAAVGPPCEHTPPMDMSTESTLNLVLKKLDRVEEAQRRTAEDVDRIGQTMTQIESMVRTVIAEVKPTIDALMANPMLRMALGIKG